MNQHKITDRQMLRCLRCVQDNCAETFLWSGQTFTDFCGKPHNMEILRMLQSKNAIRLHGADSIGNQQKLPYGVSVEDAAGVVWYENSEKWKNRICGFIAGVLTTLIAVGLPWISSNLAQ